MFKTLIRAAKTRYDAHRRYRKLIAEIEALSQDDLIDIGAFRADLIRGVRQDVFGHA